MADLDRRIAAVAADTHSLFTLVQFLDVGGSRMHASRRVRAGRWESPSPGVFRIAGVPWTYEARVYAAVLAAGPGAVVSHFCAARLLGLGFSHADPELTIPRPRRHRPNGIRAHESRDLDRCGIETISAIPVTDANRTLLDLATKLHPPSLTKAVEAARRLDLVTWKSLLRTLVAHSKQGRPGLTRLREVVVEGLVRTGVTDTDSELIALTLLLQSNLPTPELHHQIRDEDGDLLAEIDLAWVEEKAAIEIDGDVHNDPVIRSKDDARDAMLRRLGWSVRRVWRDIPVSEPARFLNLVRTELEGRRSVRRSAGAE